MKHVLKLLLLLLLLGSCSEKDLTNGTLPEISIPTNGLVAYYALDGNTLDRSANTNDAVYCNAEPGKDRKGEIDKCYVFNGVNQYIEIEDSDELSISTTGELSVSVWIRPDTYNFENTEGNGYVHWLGKGETNNHEWLMRMYNQNSDRPNRISGYAFNLSGGLGSGSYTEDVIVAGEWIHLVMVYDYPNNAIKIYKNGVLKDEDFFTDYEVIPENGTAPLRIGTRDKRSYFKGAIDELCIYSKVLTKEEINSLFLSE